QKHLRLNQVKALVLDEADRMLDLGFLEDVEKILAMLPKKRQTMLFSATMPDPIVALSRRFLTHPVTIHAGHTAESGPSPLTKQVVYRTHPLNKLEMVARILQAKDRGLTMIFCRTKRAADRVAEDLDFRGFAVAAVHGDLGQGARERALRAFRTGKVDVLVATDVAARGLDVSGVTHVINYDCPEDPDTYTHRIGRTGRAGATGVAVTFVDWEDMPRWVLIDKSMGLSMPQPPETYHTSPALFADLDIPTDISGTLPTANRSRVGLSAEIEEDLGGTRRRGRESGPSRSRGNDRGRGDAPGRGDDRDRGGRGADRHRGGRGGRFRPAGAPAETPVAEAVPAVAEETSDRPRRQRRRRRAADPLSGTGTASTEAVPEPESITVAEPVTGEAPARGPRTRRQRPAATDALFSDGSEADRPASQPEGSPAGQPGIFVANQPGAPLSDQPGASLSDQPGASLSDQSGASLSDQSGAPLSDQSGAPLDDRPGAFVAGQPEAAADIDAGAAPRRRRRGSRGARSAGTSAEGAES
ncbi:MAG: hypothetical protein QOC94_4732, partial [Actinoplanes sp.]|nr:hypothetical protein [Actinoplanes sp.]